MINSVFDINFNQFFISIFIHIFDYNLFDCKVKSFWNPFWKFFFFKWKITAKLAKKCYFIRHYGWSNFCLLSTLQKTPPLTTFSFRNTFFGWPLMLFPTPLFVAILSELNMQARCWPRQHRWDWSKEFEKQWLHTWAEWVNHDVDEYLML